MNTYAVGTLPLVNDMRAAIPEALQPWFANDAGAAGKAKYNAACMVYLDIHGPQFGYYLEQAKSWYICKAEERGSCTASVQGEGLDYQIFLGEEISGRIHWKRRLKGGLAQ